MKAKHIEIDGFSDEEIQDAVQYLKDRQTEFFRDDYVGEKLRQNAIDNFKKMNKIKTNDAYELKIHADLLDDNDVSYAIEKNMMQ